MTTVYSRHACWSSTCGA